MVTSWHTRGSLTRLFIKELGWHLQSVPGDYGTLTQTGGVYQLAEKTGITYRFRSDRKLDYIQDRKRQPDHRRYDGSGKLIRVQHSNGDHAGPGL